MDFNKIALALTACAETVDGINGYDYVPDSLANIGFYVGEIDVDLNRTMRGQRLGNGPRRGSDEATITCRILVARYDDKMALRKLREFMGGSGPLSVVDAIEQNRRLEYQGQPTVDDSAVRNMRGNRLFQVGEHRYYGVELDVFVIGDA